MSPTLTIAFRRVQPSEEIASQVESLSKRLGDRCRDITSCRVVLEQAHHRHRDSRFHVRVLVTVPERAQGGVHTHVAQGRNEDLQTALSHAFRAAERRLTGHVRRRHDGRRGQSRGGHRPCRRRDHRTPGWLRGNRAHRV